MGHIEDFHPKNQLLGQWELLDLDCARHCPLLRVIDPHAQPVEDHTSPRDWARQGVSRMAVNCSGEKRRRRAGCFCLGDQGAACMQAPRFDSVRCLALPCPVEDCVPHSRAAPFAFWRDVIPCGVQLASGPHPIARDCRKSNVASLENTSLRRTAEHTPG